jgi:hypothetical protein
VTSDEGLDDAHFQDVFFEGFFSGGRAGCGVLVNASCSWAFVFLTVAIFFKPSFFFYFFTSFSAFFSVATCFLLLVGGVGLTIWWEQRPDLHTGLAIGRKKSRSGIWL